MPCGELAEVGDDAVGVGAEVVGAVGVEEDAGGVGGVVGVAGDVVAALDDEAAAAGLGGEALCEDGACEAGSDDEEVEIGLHEGICSNGGRGDNIFSEGMGWETGSKRGGLEGGMGVERATARIASILWRWPLRERVRDQAIQRGKMASSAQ